MLKRILFFNVVLIGMQIPALAQSIFQARSGILDARHFNFETNRLALNGTWKFYDYSLFTPDLFNNEKGVESNLPGLWNESRSDEMGLGYGTYSLHVILPDSIGPLALEIPQLYSSYRLWVNDKLVLTSGKVATSKAGAEPQWIFQTVDLDNYTDTTSIVLEIANFHHAKGGLKDPIYLGTSTAINSHYDWAILSNGIEFVVLIFLAVLFGILYLKKPKQVSLYFSLLCFSWAIRSIFSNLYLSVNLFPDLSWLVVVKIEYLTLFLTILWSALLLHYLFKNYSYTSFVLMLVIINCIFMIVILVSEPITFSRWISLFLGVALITLLYAAFLIIKGLISDQPGMWYLLSSVLIGLLIFGYDLISYHTYNSSKMLLSIGYSIMFLLTGISLLFHLHIFRSNKQDNMLRYDDMFKSEN